MKSTKKRLLSSVLALILCFTMLLGTTYAWFTDSVTSGTNKIIAGNLDIEVEYKNDNTNGYKNLQGSESVFSKGLWEPGHTEFVTLKITNKGTLALKYQMNVSPITETGGINMAGAAFKLSDYLVFGTTAPATTETSYTRETARAAVGTTTKLTQSALTQNKTMQPNDVQYITLVVYMPESVGNEANYKTGTTAPEIDLGIKILATQLESELDSFGKDYDKNADYPALDKVVTYNYFPQTNQTAQLKKSAEVAQKDGADDHVVDDNNKITIKSDAKVDSSNSFAELVFDNSGITFAEGSEKATVSFTAVKKSEGNFKVEGTDMESVTFEISADVTGGTFKSGALQKVKFFVGEGKQNVTLKHGSEDMTLVEALADVDDADEFFYDKIFGFITMAVDHFSEFVSEYNAPVAAIGTKAFYSVEEAAKKVEDTETITMLRDSSEAALELPKGKEVTLDLNGQTLTASGITNNGGLTVKDSGTEGKVVAPITNKGTLAVKDGEFEKTISNEGTLKVEDGEFKEQITNVGTEAKVEATGGEFKKDLPAGSLPEGKKQDKDGKVVECQHENLPDEYEFNATDHWKVCPDCKAKVSEAHTFVEGVCACGYMSDEKLLAEHPTATCRIGNTAYDRPVADNTKVKNYKDEGCALQNAKSGDTIKMIADYSTTNDLRAITEKNDFVVTLDLNGKTITLPRSCQFNVGTYNFIDSSESKTGSFTNGIDAYNMQSENNHVVFNIYAGNYKKVVTDGDSGNKTVTVYGGNIGELQVQGSDHNGVDTVIVNGGTIEHISFYKTVNGVLTANTPMKLTEITGQEKLTYYGSQSMADAYRLYTVTAE